MYILTIDTTGPLGSVAVTDTETGRTGEKRTTEQMGHLRNLMALTDELLKEEGVRKSDICAVAASAGPGSYTGIRIGVSSARAVAQALGVPCIKVPTLGMFSALAKDRDVAVIFNARRGQVYGAVFAKGGAAVLEPGPYMLHDVTEAVRKAGMKPLFYGDGIDAYAESEQYGKLIAGYDFADKSERYQDASLAAEYALEAFRRGETCSVEELLPDYMRTTEAEQKLADGSLERLRKAKMTKFLSK